MPVKHPEYGFGTVKKFHKNGRVMVAFADIILPKTVDPETLESQCDKIASITSREEGATATDSTCYDERILTGSDYE